MLSLFPQGRPKRFIDYVQHVVDWRNSTFEERCQVLFNVLDYNGDGEISVSDITFFIQMTHQYTFKLNDRVRVRYATKKGVLRYWGPVKNKDKSEIFAGIELDEPVGFNNGSVEGVSYFSCKEKCGIFIESKFCELVD